MSFKKEAEKRKEIEIVLKAMKQDGYGLQNLDKLKDKHKDEKKKN